MEPMKKLNPAVTAIIVIVLIALAAAAVVALNNSQKAAAPVTSDSTNPSSSQPQPPSSSSQYKDGTYSATGSYSTPGGRESIDLEVTLTGGTVQDTKLTQKGMTGEAKEYQARFASGYKTEVIGKSIDEISLSRVAGSSLTSIGFNDALDQIKRDAAA